jgi:hypothetical protein
VVTHIWMFVSNFCQNSDIVIVFYFVVLQSSGLNSSIAVKLQQIDLIFFFNIDPSNLISIHRRNVVLSFTVLIEMFCEFYLIFLFELDVVLDEMLGFLTRLLLDLFVFLVELHFVDQGHLNNFWV